MYMLLYSSCIFSACFSFSPPLLCGVVRFLSVVPSPLSSPPLLLCLSSVTPPCYIPPAACLTLPLWASTSIASSVKLSCYIPPAASWALSFPVSTSIASSVKLSCYIPPAAFWALSFAAPYFYSLLCKALLLYSASCLLGPVFCGPLLLWPPL